MKKFAVAMVLVASFGLTACESKQRYTESDAPYSEERTVGKATPAAKVQSERVFVRSQSKK